MNQRTIRYKRPDWTNWTYVVVDAKDAKRMIRELKAEGYIVEG